MANRKRSIVLSCPVVAEERQLIEQKMALLPTRQIDAYLRKMAIDEYIIYTNTTNIKGFPSKLQGVGRNIYQIAKRLDSGAPAYDADIEEIKKRLEQIWHIPNSVNFADYHHYHLNKRSYHYIRRASDRLCKEHGLSVIVPGQDKGKRYAEHTAEKEGTSYKAQLKACIDRHIPVSSDFDACKARDMKLSVVNTYPAAHPASSALPV